MHQSSFHTILRFRDLVEKNFAERPIRILDVGSYGVNGTYKEIFADISQYAYTGLDVNPGPNVDYVPADPYLWTELPDESFDVIVSGQAFEHIEYPWLIIEEMSRVLRRNGLIAIVAPSRGPEHKYPVDCWRYYPDAFRALAKWANLEVIEAKTNWGQSGFTDGSDQWGDSFCILLKPKNQAVTEKHRKTTRSIPRTTNRSNPLKQIKQGSYYGFARPEVVAAIIKNEIPTGKVLEIGCAGGATGKDLKERLPVQLYVGIDISPEAADIAKNHLDRVIVANIEETDLASEHGLKTEEFDLLLALDVLEHLYNPWDTLAELSSFLKTGGYVVASLPNIQNITIIQDLIKGNWQYQNAGILDATHLRFFTFETSKIMFDGAGLTVKNIEHVINPSLDMESVKESGNNYRHGNFAIADLTKKELLHLFTYQYILIAQKIPATERLHEKALESTQPHRNFLSPKFKHKDNVPQLTSIVILTFNQLEYTKKCVKSLKKHTLEPHEIIFVDNGSTDGTVKWLKTQIKENKNYKLIENMQNLGFAKGCNQGIEASQGEFILLLNNDVVVANGWLSSLSDCLRRAPDAGIVGPMTNNISGPQQIHDDSYRSVDDLDEYAAQFQEKYRHRRIPFRRIVGFCMLFKRTLAEQIGMLDESFGTGNFEDDDFCLRAALAGCKNYIAGDVFIHHYGSRSFIGNKINYGAAISDNKKIMNKKWTLSMASPEGKRLAVQKAIELADTFYSKGMMDKAVETLIDCIKYSPGAREIYYELARFFLESKKFSEAWEVVETMEEAAKNDLKGLACAGYAKEGLGLDSEADTYAERMLAANDQYPAALNLKGVLAYKKDSKEEAADYFRKAIHAEPGYGEAHTNLGVLYWGQDKKEDAFAHMKKGFILSPTIPDASSIYYSVIASLGAFGDAGDDFREACRLHPDNKNLAFLSIDILIQQAKFNDALLQIQDVLASYGLDDDILDAALAVRDKIGPLQIGKTAKKGTLSLCMIVKNEEKHLVKCLRSIRDVVDEIIIVDTGSSDKTVDIAKIFGAKIFVFPWTGDFSAARNESLKHATGDWTLILDADEVISSLDFSELKKLIHKSSSMPVAYSIVTRNYINDVGIIGFTPNDGQYPEETGTGWIPSVKVRLVPRRKDIFFTNPVHELLEQSLKTAKVTAASCRIIVHHYGKLDAQKDLQKGEDYYLLGKIKYESDPTNMKAIFELAKQAHLLKRYDEALDLWHKLLALMKTESKSHSYQEMVKATFGEPMSEIHIQMAAACLMLNRFDEALESATVAMKGKVKLKEYVNIYAMSEMIGGSLDKAFGELNELLKTTPDYAPALLLMAAVHTLKGEKGQSRGYFDLLRQRKLQVAGYLNAMSRHLHVRGRKEEARLLLDAVRENHHGNAETLHLLEEYSKSESVKSIS